MVLMIVDETETKMLEQVKINYVVAFMRKSKVY